MSKQKKNPAKYLGLYESRTYQIKKWNLNETASFDSGLFICNFRKSDTVSEVKLFHYLFGCQMAEIWNFHFLEEQKNILIYV